MNEAGVYCMAEYVCVINQLWCLVQLAVVWAGGTKSLSSVRHIPALMNCWY